MNFLDLVRQRKSVREYQQKPIEQEKLAYIQECVRLAPSAVNFQPWRFITVTSAEGRALLHRCYPRDWFVKAPLIVIACVNHEVSWHRKSDGKDHGDIDLSIAVQHLCLAATEQGIGTCWVCNFDEALCRKLFNLPNEWEPCVLIPMGYLAEADSASPEKNRKSVSEIWQEHL